MKKPESKWTNVHDDELMVALGIRKPHLTPRDPSVWTKSPSEKKAIKKHRHSDYKYSHKTPKPYSYITAKMIIRLKRNNKFPKNTYSVVCNSSDIPDILSRYYAIKNGFTENLVISYSFNGKTYKPTERPII